MVDHIVSDGGGPALTTIVEDGSRRPPPQDWRIAHSAIVDMIAIERVG